MKNKESVNKETGEAGMVFEKVAAALAEKAGVDASAIRPDTTLEELDLDSLDTVDVFMALEEVFGISLDVSGDMKRVADVVSRVEQSGVKA